MSIPPQTRSLSILKKGKVPWYDKNVLYKLPTYAYVSVALHLVLEITPKKHIIDV